MCLNEIYLVYDLGYLFYGKYVEEEYCVWVVSIYFCNTRWISGLEGNKLGLLFLQLTRRQIKWGYCSFNIEQFQLGKLHLYSLMSEGLEKHSLSCFADLTVSPQSKYKEHPTSKLLD